MPTTVLPRLQAWARSLAHAVRRDGPGRRRPGAGVRGLRRRRSGDVPACARLLRVVHAEAGYPPHFPDAPRGWLTGPDVLEAWVVEQQGEILGHVAVSRVALDGSGKYRLHELTGRRPEEMGAVTQLFVRERVRGRGLGGALLDVALEDLRTRGLLPVIEVPSRNTDAIGLVEGRGWRLLAQDPLEDDGWLWRYASPLATLQTTGH